jgi:hypothetical protein
MANFRRLVEACAASLGATIEINQDRLGIIAPKGMHWGMFGGHELIMASVEGNWRPAAWQWEEAWERIKDERPDPCTSGYCPSWVDDGCEWWEEA